MTCLDAVTDQDAEAERQSSAALVQDAIAQNGAFWPE